MSQDLKDLQTGPVLTLDPFQDTKQEIKPEEKEEPVMDERRRAENGRAVCKPDRSDEFDHDSPVWSRNTEKDGRFFGDGA